VGDGVGIVNVWLISASLDGETLVCACASIGQKFILLFTAPYYIDLDYYSDSSYFWLGKQSYSASTRNEASYGEIPHSQDSALCGAGTSCPTGQRKSTR
jgi:hypothetical protein